MIAASANPRYTPRFLPVRRFARNGIGQAPGTITGNVSPAQAALLTKDNAAMFAATAAAATAAGSGCYPAPLSQLSLLNASWWLNALDPASAARLQSDLGTVGWSTGPLPANQYPKLTCAQIASLAQQQAAIQKQCAPTAGNIRYSAGVFSCNPSPVSIPAGASVVNGVIVPAAPVSYSSSSSPVQPPGGPVGQPVVISSASAPGSGLPGAADLSSLSSLPWWVWAGAAVGLYLMVK